MEYENVTDFEEKRKSSQWSSVERESRLKDKKKLNGYDERDGTLKDTYEMFGIKNSFDDISVGSDKDGRISMIVTADKGLNAPTFNSGKKKLKGSRMRRSIFGRGDFYFNSASKEDGAFGFRAEKDLTEARIYREFKAAAKKRVSPKMRESAPFLDIDEDMEQLREMQSRGDNASYEQRREKEQSVNAKKMLENRFLKKLRKARKQSYSKFAVAELEENTIAESILNDSESADSDENENKNNNNNIEQQFE